MNTVIKCPKCRKVLSGEQFDRAELSACPSCKRLVQVQTFPVFFSKTTVGSVGESLMSDDEAGCFYHPHKRAIVHCQQCGRFLCALCDIEISGQHLCAACLESGKKKGKLKNLENHRTLYDSVALRLSLYPLLLFYPTFISAPATIFVAIRYWKTPGSIVRRSKVRFVVAIVIAILEIVAWVLLFLFIFQVLPGIFLEDF
ncbi:MAG: hypothetical protein GY801_38415 [bacterium]|nr:hypothetical protein [bacterium]